MNATPITGQSTPNKPFGRWPKKVDYKFVSRSEAISLVADFGKLGGFDILRERPSFANLVFCSAENLDSWDLREAIRIAISQLSKSSSLDASQRRLWARLEAHCGPLDQPVALTIHCWPLVLPAGAAST